MARKVTFRLENLQPGKKRYASQEVWEATLLVNGKPAGVVKSECMTCGFRVKWSDKAAQKEAMSWLEVQPLPPILQRMADLHEQNPSKWKKVGPLDALQIILEDLWADEMNRRRGLGTMDGMARWLVPGRRR